MDKKKIFKIVIVIILIILVLYLIYGFRNYVILKDIAKKVEENEKSTNYSFSALGKDDKEVMTTYFKDGIIVSKEKDKVLSWKDDNNGESILINYDDNTAQVRKNGDSYGGMPVPWIRNPSIISAFKVSISEEEINGEECYVVASFAISKEKGTLIRKYFGDEYYTELRDWEFGKVTDKDVERPNLDGFQIVEIPIEE